MSNTTDKYIVGSMYKTRKLIEIFRSKPPENRLKARLVCVNCGRESICRASDLNRIGKCICQIIKYNNIQSQERLYRIWSHIKDRCNNPNCDRYYLYGAKGIKICKDWENNFLSFAEWSLNHGYADDLTIDRIDSSKDYSPDNCQWITRGENTAKSNKISQHRKANKGTYYYISPDGKYGTFENASQFSKNINISAEKIRWYADKNSGVENKRMINGWTFWHI